MIQKKHIGLAVSLSLMLSSGVAMAYATKLHLITGEHLSRLVTRDSSGRCKIAIYDWNRVIDGVDLRATVMSAAPSAARAAAASNAQPGNQPAKKAKSAGATYVPATAMSALPLHTVTLSAEFCTLMTDARYKPYFLSGTTGPDTFPGLFGNTDPSHALGWNTAWQISVLWQNATQIADENEKRRAQAFVLGWLVHFAGDLNAHGLANLHAGGVWMSDRNPNAPANATGLAAVSEQAKSAWRIPKTIWGHLMTEVYYYDNFFEFPAGFDNALQWPIPFVKKMFFNPESPLYKHMDYLFVRYARDSDRPVGVVSLMFWAAQRTLFLLWNHLAKMQAAWERYRDSIANPATWDSWLKQKISNAIAVWFKTKAYHAKRAIRRWIKATHRAQQAIVADTSPSPKAVFRGDKKYRADDDTLKRGIEDLLGRPTGSSNTTTATYVPEYLTNFYSESDTEKNGTLFQQDLVSSRGSYSSGNIQGVVDAYIYMKEAIYDLANPSMNLTCDNQSVLGPLVNELGVAGVLGAGFLTALCEIRDSVETWLASFVHPLREMFDAAIDPFVEQLKYYLSDAAVRALMPDMRARIDAQMAAFGIPKKGNAARRPEAFPDGYMKWPIYRNSITMAALMIEQLQNGSANWAAGNETMSPAFGLPSGDFGCTLGCTSAYKARPGLFMPVAGTYYQNRKIRGAFPDYCMATTAEKRRTKCALAGGQLDEMLNEPFGGLSNASANGVSDAIPAFTCLRDAAPPSSRPGGLTIRRDFVIRQLAMVPRDRNFRWGKASKVGAFDLVFPRRNLSGAAAQAPVNDCGVADTFRFEADPLLETNIDASTLLGAILKTLGKSFGRLVTDGRWEYRKHLIPRGNRVVLPADAERVNEAGQFEAVDYVSDAGTAIAAKIADKTTRPSVCYLALKYDSSTLSTVPEDPVNFYANRFRSDPAAAPSFDGFLSSVATEAFQNLGSILGLPKEAGQIPKWFVETAKKLLLRFPSPGQVANAAAQAAAEAAAKACTWVEEKVAKYNLTDLLNGAAFAACRAVCAPRLLISRTAYEECVAATCQEWTIRQVCQSVQ